MLINRSGYLFVTILVTCIAAGAAHFPIVPFILLLSTAFFYFKEAQTVQDELTSRVQSRIAIALFLVLPFIATAQFIRFFNHLELFGYITAFAFGTIASHTVMFIAYAVFFNNRVPIFRWINRAKLSVAFYIAGIGLCSSLLTLDPIEAGPTAVVIFLVFAFFHLSYLYIKSQTRTAKSEDTTIPIPHIDTFPRESQLLPKNPHDEVQQPNPTRNYWL